MYGVRISITDKEPFIFEYETIKEYKSVIKFWAGREPSFLIEFLGELKIV